MNLQIKKNWYIVFDIFNDFRDLKKFYNLHWIFKIYFCPVISLCADTLAINYCKFAHSIILLSVQ